MKERRFTLIELLVVCMIIGILAGLLLPALNQVRNKARSTGCINNLKQQFLGVQNYYEAFDDILLPRFTASTNGAGLYAFNRPGSWWVNSIDSAISVETENAEAANRWKFGPSISICPASNPKTDKVSTSSSEDGWMMYRCYGISYGLAWSPAPGELVPRYVRKFTAIRDPSNVVLISDFAHYSSGFNPTSDNDINPDKCRKDFSVFDNTYTGRLAYRHSGRINMLMLGGNVASTLRLEKAASFDSDKLTS